MTVDVLIRVPRNQYSAVGRNLVLYSLCNPNNNGSTPIRDSTGSHGPMSTIAVPFDNGTESFQISFQVIGCSLSTSIGKTLIDTTTNRLVNEDEPRASSPSNTSKWDDWSPEMIQSNK